MDVRLDQVNIVVRDMDAMAGFYQRLGLDLVGGTGAWAPHHRNAVDAGGAHVDLDSPAFAATWDEGWPGGPGIVLGFRVEARDDVDRLHAELVAAGHASQQPPYDAFWGARYAVVTDPDGNAVGLMSPIDQARRTGTPPPPAPG
jgi:catechol 2,3-dioxygenase-like lactoylglutathione lyase family enzyme